MALGELLELLQGQRIDRPHGLQLPLELAGPGGGADPLGQQRALGGQSAASGSTSSSPRSGLGRRLEPGSHLGVGDLGLAAGAGPVLLQLGLRRGPLGAEGLEPLGRGPGRLGLATTLLATVREVRLDRAHATVTNRPEPLGGGQLGPRAVSAWRPQPAGVGDQPLQTLVEVLEAVGDVAACVPRSAAQRTSVSVRRERTSAERCLEVAHGSRPSPRAASVRFASSASSRGSSASSSAMRRTSSASRSPIWFDEPLEVGHLLRHLRRRPAPGGRRHRRCAG